MKVICIVLGFIFFGLGAVGVVLPVLPTTPFLLLAGFFFAKGSERFNRWFLGTSLYKNHLDSFVKSRSMTLKTKASLLAFASTMLIIAFFMVDIIYVRILIIGLIVFKYYYFAFRIKTIKPEEVQRD
ncbi:MAG: YbaN family protein [Eubacterium sp.]|nr:YbaN family protein [Eubacterium sp.]